MMSGFNPRFKILIPLGGAVVFGGVAGYIFYRLLKEDDDDNEDDDKPPQNSDFPVIALTTVEIKVPKDAVGAIIGRQGTNVKSIQEKTSTLIKFRDDVSDLNERTCIIRGKIEKVEHAKQLILKAVEDIPIIETLDLQVPVQAIGRIIGRNGDSIKYIQRISGAKIKVQDQEPQSFDESVKDDSTRKIVIKGTSEQLKAAQSSILEKVKEEEAMREQIKTSALHISHRSNIRLQQNGHAKPISNLPVEEVPHVNLPSPSKLFTEVFVSAVDTPTHFWLQVVGSRTIELDRLVEEMTDYYNDDQNKELHLLDKINQDDIVAACFPLDNMWYRGRICEQDKDDPSRYKVFFVDFGDVEAVPVEKLMELRTDFLRLNFQAVEAFLANIDTESALGEEALEVFESLTYATQWKPVMVKVLGYKHEGQDTIPYVQVVDTTGTQDVDVAKELVKRGLAKWSEDKLGSLSSSIASLPDSISM